MRRHRSAPCADAVRAVLTAMARLDVLANVAGIGFSRRIGEVTPEEWRRVIDVNLTGTFLLSQAALARLARGAEGSIVNMASVAGLRATPYNAAYCASKGGVIMLTKSMALELAAPGYGSMRCARPRSTHRSSAAFELPEGADMALLTRSASPMGRLIDVARGCGRRGLPGVRRRGDHQRHDPRHRRRRDRLTRRGSPFRCRDPSGAPGRGVRR